MKRSRAAALTLSLVFILGCAISAAAGLIPAITGESTHTERTLYNGVQYAEIRTASGTATYANQHINVVTFDLKQQDLYLEPAYYNDAAVVNYSYSTVGGIIKNYNAKNAAAGKTAVAAVNGDMWLTHWALGDRGNLTAINKAKRDITISRSFNMVNGEIYTSETSRQEIAIETSSASQNSWSFGITDDYIPIFGQPHTVITITDANNGKTAISDGINRFPVNDTLFIYTDRLMGSRRDFVQDDAYELLVEFDTDYTLGADTAVSGTVKAVYDAGTAENPPYLTNKQMVITARGNKVSSVSSFKVGDTLNISVKVEDYAGDSERWGRVQNAVSGSLPLVKDGAVKSAEIDLVASPGYPTTILGHNRAGKIVLLTMDGRGVGGAGGSAARYKQIIKDYDLYNALLLDGGGSMTMVAATDTSYTSYKTVSTPSDGADRTIDDALILAFGPKRQAQGEFNVEDPYNKTDPLNITFPSETFVKAFKEFSNQTDMSCEDGALKLTVSGYDGSGASFDPYVIFSFDKLSNKASADEYKFITLVYKMPTTNSRKQTGPEYYGTEVCREYYSTNPKQFTYMTDQYEYVTFDMSSVSDWTGNIAKLRLDYMFASGRDGDTMYIHNILFSKTKAKGDAMGKSIAGELNAPAPEETEPEETTREEGVKDPNTWLCNRGGPFYTGWWMGRSVDPDVADWEINVSFDTPYAFDSFIMACYANDTDPAVVSVRLLDKNGETLEGAGLTVSGNHATDQDGYITLRFSRAYAAGAYTIQFVYEEGSHFCLGSASVGEVDAAVSGNGITNKETKAAPAIVLYGAIPPSEETEPEETETEPEATETEPDEPETEPEATETEPDESETEPEATETEPEETETEPEITETEPEETETEPEITETEPEETETEPEITETEPGESETEPEITETDPETTEPEETEPERPVFILGDINGDGEVNNKDVVVLFRYVSSGEAAEDESIYDFNGDGEVNNKDVVALFRYISVLV